MSLRISLTQIVRVNLIGLMVLGTLGFGLATAAWAQNTAFGTNALSNNTTGNENSAFGASALISNKTGYGNTATGWDALYSNSLGFFNTATGESALAENSTGIGNTAMGIGSLFSNQRGNQNAATGWNALYFNSGDNNTAIGAFALQDNTSGSNNIAVGLEAGLYLTTGSYNIEKGNSGVAGDADSIRIGTVGAQTATYIAGIFGASVTGGCEVVVESSGQLGCMKSSARYKRDIRDMGNASDKLMKLRPVTFRYKGDETSAQQYGLIAEEVEKVYPELVIHGAHGEVETVAYQMLPAMLLNEVQNLVRQIEQKDALIAALQRQVVAIRKKSIEIDAVAARLEVLERQANASDPIRLASAWH